MLTVFAIVLCIGAAVGWNRTRAGGIQECVALACGFDGATDESVGVKNASPLLERANAGQKTESQGQARMSAPPKK
jgi:hypothetical protein